eukprot:Cvel_28472.t1-p1 / transcript=Cvel_28472.t1 / gene=Cvel_28472 / organism=Chromera_velia_CCMP2878 / gene_product=hypothetical protein / transcript_product=hypothetical protein / location=Cvel_scaffold3734:9712-14262(+) / protein_length=1224 / sequence_SO=supercontig / SO=protein_coding / is_pseudo=false
MTSQSSHTWTERDKDIREQVRAVVQLLYRLRLRPWLDEVVGCLSLSFRGVDSLDVLRVVSEDEDFRVLEGEDPVTQQKSCLVFFDETPLWFQGWLDVSFSDPAFEVPCPTGARAAFSAYLRQVITDQDVLFQGVNENEEAKDDSAVGGGVGEADNEAADGARRVFKPIAVRQLERGVTSEGSASRLSSRLRAGAAGRGIGSLCQLIAGLRVFGPAFLRLSPLPNTVLLVSLCVADLVAASRTLGAASTCASPAPGQGGSSHRDLSVGTHPGALSRPPPPTLATLGSEASPRVSAVQSSCIAGDWASGLSRLCSRLMLKREKLSGSLGGPSSGSLEGEEMRKARVSHVAQRVRGVEGGGLEPSDFVFESLVCRLFQTEEEGGEEGTKKVDRTIARALCLPVLRALSPPSFQSQQQQQSLSLCTSNSMAILVENGGGGGGVNGEKPPPPPSTTTTGGVRVSEFDKAFVQRYGVSLGALFSDRSQQGTGDKGEMMSEECCKRVVSSSLHSAVGFLGSLSDACKVVERHYPNQQTNGQDPGTEEGEQLVIPLIKTNKMVGESSSDFSQQTGAALKNGGGQGTTSVSAGPTPLPPPARSTKQSRDPTHRPPPPQPPPQHQPRQLPAPPPLQILLPLPPPSSGSGAGRRLSASASAASSSPPLPLPPPPGANGHPGPIPAPPPPSAPPVSQQQPSPLAWAGNDEPPARLSDAHLWPPPAPPPTPPPAPSSSHHHNNPGAATGRPSASLSYGSVSQQQQVHGNAAHQFSVHQGMHHCSVNTVNGLGSLGVVARGADGQSDQGSEAGGVSPPPPPPPLQKGHVNPSAVSLSSLRGEGGGLLPSAHSPQTVWPLRDTQRDKQQQHLLGRGASPFPLSQATDSRRGPSPTTAVGRLEGRGPAGMRSEQTTKSLLSETAAGGGGDFFFSSSAEAGGREGRQREAGRGGSGGRWPQQQRSNQVPPWPAPLLPQQSISSSANSPTAWQQPGVHGEGTDGGPGIPSNPVCESPPMGPERALFHQHPPSMDPGKGGMWGGRNGGGAMTIANLCDVIEASRPNSGAGFRDQNALMECQQPPPPPPPLPPRCVVSPLPSVTPTAPPRLLMPPNISGPPPGCGPGDGWGGGSPQSAAASPLYDDSWAGAHSPSPPAAGKGSSGIPPPPPPPGPGVSVGGRPSLSGGNGKVSSAGMSIGSHTGPRVRPDESLLSLGLWKSRTEDASSSVPPQQSQAKPPPPPP